MKKSNITKQVLLMLLIMIGGSLKAQVEFAPIGAEWHYEYKCFWVTGYVNIKSESDTIIDGIKCKKLVKSRSIYNHITQDSSYYILGYEYVTQINDSVMIYRYNKLRKLYDFNSEIGDTITFPGNKNNMTEPEFMYGKAVIVDKGIVNVDGNDFKYIDIETINDLYGEYQSPWGFSAYGFDLSNTYVTRICEKIGNMYGYLLPEAFYVADEEEGGELRCYSDNIISASFSDKQCDYIEIVSIDESQFEDVEIFPNPTEGKIKIELKHDYNTINIYDNFGRVILSCQTNNNSLNLDLSDYPSGLYLIFISNETDSYFKRIIKK